MINIRQAEAVALAEFDRCGAPHARAPDDDALAATVIERVWGWIFSPTPGDDGFPPIGAPCIAVSRVDGSFHTIGSGTGVHAFLEEHKERLLEMFRGGRGFATVEDLYDPTVPCAVCATLIERRTDCPDRVCDTCVAQATDANGRADRFTNLHPNGYGLRGSYVDTGELYKEGVSCRVFVRGVACIAFLAPGHGVFVRKG